MKSLDELMALPGAIAAFECSGNGALLRHVIARGSELRPDTLDLVAHMCAANLSIATMQARGWEMTTNTSGFYPIHSCTVVGMDWSVTIVGGAEAEQADAAPQTLRGLVCANRKADYEAVTAALAEP